MEATETSRPDPASPSKRSVPSLPSMASAPSTPATPGPLALGTQLAVQASWRAQASRGAGGRAAR